MVKKTALFSWTLFIIVQLRSSFFGIAMLKTLHLLSQNSFPSFLINTEGFGFLNDAL